MSNNKYQLRYAAGLYWLINMNQPGNSYQSPVPMNEVGAQIWKMAEKGTPQDQICRQLCEEYDISLEQAQSDVNTFFEELQRQNIDWRGAAK